MMGLNRYERYFSRDQPVLKYFSSSKIRVVHKSEIITKLVNNFFFLIGSE